MSSSESPLEIRPNRAMRILSQMAADALMDGAAKNEIDAEKCFDLGLYVLQIAPFVSGRGHVNNYRGKATLVGWFVETAAWEEDGKGKSAWLLVMPRGILRLNGGMLVTAYSREGFPWADANESTGRPVFQVRATGPSNSRGTGAGIEQLGHSESPAWFAMPDDIWKLVAP